MSSWKDYEREVHGWFRAKYRSHEILSVQKVMGRYSLVARQVDILVRIVAPEADLVGVFDCKHFSRNVDVKTIDSLVGFIDDVGADYGGVVTSKGFTVAAVNRARAAQPRIVTSVFKDPVSVVDDFVFSLDFSDPRNSGYLAQL